MMLDKVLGYLEKEADDYEIYMERGKKLEITLEAGEIKHISRGKMEGYGIRAIVNRGIGFSSSSSQNDLLSAGRMAVSLAKIDDSKNGVGFPVPSKYPDVKGIYDRKIEEITPEDLHEYGREILLTCEEEGVELLYCEVVSEIQDVKLINSNGLVAEERGTVIGVLVEVKYGDATAYEFESSRKKDIEFSTITGKSAEIARESSGGGEIDGEINDVILSPHAVNSLFSNVLYPAFSGEAVIKGRSPLSDKLSEEISPGLTLTDDGTYERGLFSSSFDDEGTPEQKTPIIKNGILENFLYDFTYGMKAKTESSGNSFRENYSSQPYIKPTNVIVEHEDCTRDVFYDKAIYVHTFIGAHTANAVSGDFSLEGRNAFIIRNGERRPVKSVMLYGNIYEILKRIECSDKNIRQSKNTVTGNLRAGGFRISG